MPGLTGIPFAMSPSRSRNKSRDFSCKLRSHQFGWALLLFVGAQAEVVQTQVCRSQDEVLDTGDRWKAAMIEKGWK